MSTDTTGYIQPTLGPDEDDVLDKFMHDVVAGVLGMAGDLVRPRWQKNVPNLPARDVNWISFGIMLYDPQDLSAFIGDDGTMLRQETFDLMVSSYGRRAAANARLLRDGLQLSQNREAMASVGMGLIEAGQIMSAPTLVKDVYLRRFDMRMQFSRQVRREYPVLNIVSIGADSIIDNEKWKTPIEVTQ